MRVCCMGQKATNVVYDLVALVAAPSWDVRASWALLQAPAPRRLFLDLFLHFVDLFPDLIRRPDLFPVASSARALRARLPPLLDPLSAA